MSVSPIDVAARIATAQLAEQNLGSTYFARHDISPQVSGACIRDLVTSGKLTDAGDDHVITEEVEQLFSRTRVIDDTDFSYVRVSITPLGQSKPVDPLGDGSIRRFTGYDFANRDHLTPLQRAAGIEGVWPLSEDALRTAELIDALFLPSMKGFVDGSIVSRVAGYALDLTTGNRRWVRTAHWSIREIGGGWDHLWVNVPRGPVAALVNRSTFRA